MAKTIDCSFCGKDQHKVRKIIAGPDGIFICDECVLLCSDIIQPEGYVDRKNFIRECVLAQNSLGPQNAAEQAVQVWDKHLGPPKTLLTSFKPEAKAS